MSGVPQIEIRETAEKLKELMKKQKTGIGFAKVQTLYLFKIKAVESVRHLAVLVGRGESTIHRWLKVYRERGIQALLKDKEEEEGKEDTNKIRGRKEIIDVETAAAIQQELKEPDGFKSYQEVKQWLEIVKEAYYSYPTIYRICRNEFKAKLKVPRPRSSKQEEGAINKFREKLADSLSSIVSAVRQERGKELKIRYWCEDETRLGLQTINGRKLTLKGVKPQGEKQWKFDYYYLYGLVEPKTGESFYYEFSHLNLVCFETFLQLFASQYPEDVQILQLDNASSHTSKRLKLPDNIILFYQPPYTPEVNPIERFWQYLKSFLKWLNLENLAKLRNEVSKNLQQISQDTIISLTGWDFILDALSLSGI